MSGQGLTLRFLGDVTVERAGTSVALPPSRKTRALLAYLVLSRRPQRRERLCELFWELPDDPRGALRWSLSKLRPLVDEPERPRILADRETVAFDADGVFVDLLVARRRIEAGLLEVTPEELSSLADLFRGTFLEGLDFSELHQVQAWIVAERDAARRLHLAILDALVERLAGDPEAVLALPLSAMISVATACRTGRWTTSPSRRSSVI